MERLNSLACEMPSCVVVQVNTVESLEYISSQMQTLRRRMELFPAVSSSSLDASVASSSMGRSSRHRLIVDGIAFSTEKEQYTLDLKHLDGMITNVEDELRTPLIQDYIFEFTSQPDDELKVGTIDFKVKSK